MGETFQPKLEGRYVGVDPSLSNTGLVCVSPLGEILDQQNVKTSSKTMIEMRLEHIADKVLEFTERNTPNMVGIEGLAYSKQANKAHTLAALHFYLRLRLWQAGRSFIVVTPSQLKKLVTGKGNAKKEVMLLASYRKWGIEFKDNNICDAFGLAMYAAKEYPVASKQELVKR